MRAHSFSIIFPCFNDALTIGPLVACAEKFARRFTDDFEIIVVNDGSTDPSAALLERLKTRLPQLRVITHGRNRGYGAALRSGFSAAEKDLVFYTDGDGQYDPLEFARLYLLLETGIEVVNGFKARRRDPFYRVLIGKIYQRAVRFLFALPIRDVNCDFRLIRRTALDQIELEHDSGVICVEMIKKMHLAGCHFAESEITHQQRLHGTSQFFNLSRVSRSLWDLAWLWCRLMAWRILRANVHRLWKTLHGLYQPVQR